MPAPIVVAAGAVAKKAAAVAAKKLATKTAKKAANRKKKGGPGPTTKLVAAGLALLVAFFLFQAQLISQTISAIGGAVGADDGNDEACETAPGGAYTTVAQGSGNADRAMKYLLSVGLNPAQAAGVVGNWQQEATPAIDPSISNSLGYRGIAQWDPEHRWPNLVRFSTAKNLNPMSLEAQVRFAAWELGWNTEWDSNPGYAGVGAAVKKATASAESAKIIFDRYEIPGDDTLPNRQAFAAALEKKYANQGGSGQNQVSAMGARNRPSTAGMNAALLRPPALAAVEDGGANQDAWRIPTTVKYTITSGFGSRPSPGGVGSTNHEGIDLKLVPTGSPIVAAAAGTVRIAGSYYGMGTTVAIDHPNGIRTYYGHMKKLDPAMRVGVTVVAGQQLGWEGSTGNSTGAHLHFGVQRNGTFIEPAAFMRSKNVPLNGAPGAAGTTGVSVSGTPGAGCDSPDVINASLGFDGSNRPGSLTKSTTYRGHVNYQQCDPSWANVKTSNGARICAIGCGPFSMANIIQNFGINVDPSKLTLESSRLGITSSGGSAGVKVVEHFAPKFGLRHEVLPAGKKDAIINALKRGGQVMIGGKGGGPYLVDTGHIISLYGYDDATDSFLVSDPGRRANNPRTWPASEVLAHTDNFGSGRTQQKAIAVYKQADNA